MTPRPHVATINRMRALTGLTLCLVVAGCGARGPECKPQCDGYYPRACGDDGCGGSCGGCPTGYTCTAAFECKRDGGPIMCGGTCSGVICGGPGACCQPGSGCTYAGCNTWPCGCTQGICSPSMSGLDCQAAVANCRSTCGVQESTCCMNYLGMHPGDGCKKGP